MAAQECVRENCTRKVDVRKRGSVFCHQHIGGVADSVGAAKSASLSGIRPAKVQREKIEHNDPDFGGVEQPEDKPLEGIVIETDEQREKAEAAEAERAKEIESLAAEMGTLEGPIALYNKFKKRQDDIKTRLKDLLDEGSYSIAGVDFDITEKEVFDAKLATAAAASEDADGNKVKPLITKAQYDKICVQTPNAAKANAEFKNDPATLAKLKKPQKSLAIKEVKVG